MAETKSMEKTSATTSAENGMAAVAYILTWVTGLIVLLTAKKDEKFKRWHAIQAIGLGIVSTVLWVLMSFVFVGMVATPGTAAMWGLISMVVYLAIIAAIIFMAVTAYQGKKVRLPLIAGFADKNA